MHGTSRHCAALVASVLVLTLSLHIVHADDNNWQQLLKPHPRLVVTDDGLAKLKTLISQDAGAAAVYASVLSTGKSILKTAIIQCPKLLPVRVDDTLATKTNKEAELHVLTYTVPFIWYTVPFIWLFTAATGPRHAAVVSSSPERHVHPGPAVPAQHVQQ